MLLPLHADVPGDAGKHFFELLKNSYKLERATAEAQRQCLIDLLSSDTELDSNKGISGTKAEQTSGLAKARLFLSSHGTNKAYNNLQSWGRVTP